MEAQKERKENIPDSKELEQLQQTYLNVLNKKKVLYKYVFWYNNKKFKFKLLSTYYEYLTVCKNLITDVTKCDIFFYKKLFFEVIKKPFYYPYVLYIYDESVSQQNETNIQKNDKTVNTSDTSTHLRLIKISFLDIDEIINKSKKKEEKYFNKKSSRIHTSEIIRSIYEINDELNLYNLKKEKTIVGYIELYLLFHIGRFFDSRIERIVIHKLFRNQKLGNLMMHISIYLLKYIYISNRCDLTAENEIAIKLYKKLRFRKVDTNVFRLYLHSTYNCLNEKKTKENFDLEDLNVFMNLTFASILPQTNNRENK